MNKKAEYGGNAMFQNNKKAAFLDYLMIIVGTALMATAINSVFDMSGMVTGGFSGIAILVKERRRESCREASRCGSRT